MLYRGSKFLVLSCSLFLVGAIDAPSALSPGDTDTNSETPSQPLREIVQAPDNCPAEVCNPCCPPPCPPAWRFDLKGSFLYWYANQSGMAFTNKAQSTFTTSDFSNGTLVNPSYDWEPGLRVDAAYGFDRSYWYLGADVICYWGKGSGSQSTTSINGLFPALSFASDSLSSDYANSATFKWTLNTTIFDLLAYYDWVYNSYFTLTPTFGVRNAWLTQKATAQYEGGTYQAAPDIVNLKSKFYGVGPRLAIRPKFLLGKGFSFYAEGAGAVFGGWFDVTQSEKFLSTTRASLKKDVSGVRWGVDATAGFLYVYELRSKSSVSLDLGFDFMWFNQQNEFVHGSQFSLPEQGSSLMLYGGRAALGYRF